MLVWNFTGCMEFTDWFLTNQISDDPVCKSLSSNKLKGSDFGLYAWTLQAQSILQELGLDIYHTKANSVT